MKQKKANDSRATVLVFEQQLRESDKALATFSFYLTLEAEQSTREVGESWERVRID